MFARRLILIAFAIALAPGATAQAEPEAFTPGDSLSTTDTRLPGPPIIDPIPDDTEIPLAWWNVLILVNEASPAGLEIVKMYRQFHPEISDSQIVYLSGLTDSASSTASPADEILSRADFESLITFLLPESVVRGTIKRPSVRARRPWARASGTGR